MAKAWFLTSRPTGLPSADNFALRDLPDLPLGEDQLRVRNHWLSVDPYMRGRMNEGASYAPAYPLDTPLTGGAIGEVLESRIEGFAPGDLILHLGGWRDGGIITLDHMPRLLPVQWLDSGIKPQCFLHNMGLTGGTAWIGLLQVAAARPGDVVFVSAAAGAVGSAVVQLAKAREMTVIASAGGPEKGEWVRDLGADAVFDYKQGGVLDQLRGALTRLGKPGIDVYFDNVGGEHLDAALATANGFARFALCGMIDIYNGAAPQPLRYIGRAIAARIRMEGFIYSDLFSRYMEEFYADMGGLIASGAVQMRETVHDGLESAPTAFGGLFAGQNIGKMLVRL
ncbi:NADP-dependent oxidoreductase [Sphingopyxis sp. MWB1]|uniref:NADP-dependent oxidoreductase n=1 Tax=Sphingopyxis sp. MWB1 TaxID=1537715 RepID=UPI0009DF7010|nr:NADP-dependent oxidoreductase [Sphingopyxis sp. MWB1]